MRRAAGQWVDAEVVAVEAGRDVIPTHQLRLKDGGGGLSLLLHPWNHSPHVVPSSEFEQALTEWKATLRDEYGQIFDAVLGTSLNVLDQCVAIDVSGNAELDGVKDAGGLSAWLGRCHQQLCQGAESTAPSAALLTGPPAAGKTSLLNQVIMHLSLIHI